MGGCSCSVCLSLQDVFYSYRLSVVLRNKTFCLVIVGSWFRIVLYSDFHISIPFSAMPSQIESLSSISGAALANVSVVY
jgi:hypothetical protein